MGFCWESVGEVVSQVCEVDANGWEDAKLKAFSNMKKGDILAECPPKAIKEDGYPGYNYIDENMCTNYARLERGTWVNRDDGSEYWEHHAWYFSDTPYDFLDWDGTMFTDWKTGEEEDE